MFPVRVNINSLSVESSTRAYKPIELYTIDKCIVNFTLRQKLEF